MKDMPIGSYGIIEANTTIARYSGWLIQRETIAKVQAVGRTLGENWSALSEITLPVRLLTNEELLEYGIAYYGSQKTLWRPS